MACYGEPSPVGRCCRKRCKAPVPLRLLADGLCPPCFERRKGHRMVLAALCDLGLAALGWLMAAAVVVGVVVAAVRWLGGT